MQAHLTSPFAQRAPLTSGTLALGRCLSGMPCSTPGFFGWRTTRCPRLMPAHGNITTTRLSRPSERAHERLDHCIGSRVWLMRSIQRQSLGVQACCALRDAILGLDKAPTVVPELMYHMRINGAVLDHNLLVSVGGHLRSALIASLCGDLPCHSWWASHHGVASRSIGFRPVCRATRVRGQPRTLVCDHWGLVSHRPIRGGSWLTSPSYQVNVGACVRSRVNTQQDGEARMRALC